ncbi:S-adenosyl-L-methionine-dependent methyltransferase [Fusarium flagelliforme]|uniref:S-adenosyl-L-methionine-dependent methyltransferase n=1 Tax=Fusarium flagelliforme TaxID=2675880 RepID=UPI001E8D7BB9|nr:S-adenosyl-L-methionine-dependent methyltransferase [Fusarium flagelliforme]KAH7184733.1 S-adenosyl-L-methionine-dependent methyltransferase [Fusarium flagelliforme]
MTVQIEADPTLDVGHESDISAESDTESTASITSSIFENHYFQGRSYANPKYGKHWAPNDEEQLEALDLIHHWLTLMLDDKLFLPPIGDNPQKVLDIGTGSGIWAINMADEFPSAQVIATDITPSQPNFVPPNVEFQIDDATMDWTFEPESFDFIHIRYLQGTIDDWDKFYGQVYKFLKPGGWFQHIEPDLQMYSQNSDVKVDDEQSSIYTRWAKIFESVGEKINRTFNFSNGKLQALAENANFSNITFQTHKVPVGRWPKDKRQKEIGTFVGLSFSQALDGFIKLPLCEILKWSPEEMQLFAAEMRREIMNLKTQTVGHVFSVYGQKPEGPKEGQGRESPVE